MIYQYFIVCVCMFAFVVSTQQINDIFFLFSLRIILRKHNRYAKDTQTQTFSFKDNLLALLPFLCARALLNFTASTRTSVASHTRETHLAEAVNKNKKNTVHVHLLNYCSFVQVAT